MTLTQIPVWLCLLHAHHTNGSIPSTFRKLPCLPWPGCAITSFHSMAKITELHLTPKTREISVFWHVCKRHKYDFCVQLILILILVLIHLLTFRTFFNDKKLWRNPSDWCTGTSGLYTPRPRSTAVQLGFKGFCQDPNNTASQYYQK